MRQGKILALLLALLIAATVLTGCSPAEKAMYQWQKETAQLTTYQSSGEIVVQINQLPKEASDDPEFSQSAFLKMLKNLTFTYTGKVDTEKQLMSCAVNVRLSDSLAPQELLSVFSKDHVFYVKIDNLVKFIKTLGLVDDQEKDSPYWTILENQKYLSISAEETSALLTSTGSVKQGQSLESLWDMEKMKKQQDLTQKIISGLMNAFDGYETGLVEKQGDKIVLTFTTDRLIDLIKSLTVYCIENADKIAGVTQTTLEDLDDEELTMLGLDPAKRDLYSQNIADTAAQMANSGPEMLDDFDEEMQSEMAESLHAILGDTKITLTLEKPGTDKFDSTVEALVEFHDPDNPEDMVSLSLNIKDRTEKSSSFEVEVPTEGIITLTDLGFKLAKEMEINVKGGYYTLTQGFSSTSGEIDAAVLNNRTVVPLRTVAEAFNETVGWDASQGKAFVKQNGKTIYLAGVNRNGRSFVYLKELEKLGYKVSWDAKTGTVTVVKP